MTMRTKTGLEILQAAALIGILGDVLLRGTPWGLNAFLFVTAFAAGLVMLMFRHRPELLSKNRLALIGAMIFFASMFLLRDTEGLLVYDTLAILVIMGVLMLAVFNLKEQLAGVLHYAASFAWSGLTSLFGAFLLLGADIKWNAAPRSAFSRIVFSILRGVAFALPLILIFGALFMAADAAFEGFVNRAINIDIDVIVGHVLLASFLAWLTAGYFRGALFTPFSGASTSTAGASLLNLNFSETRHTSSEKTFVEKSSSESGEAGAALPDNRTVIEHINQGDEGEAGREDSAPNDRDAGGTSPDSGNFNEFEPSYDWLNFENTSLPRIFTLGAIEIAIILGLLDLLFASFVIMQLPYLFGGIELVQSTQDFKLAEYARRGFGELVGVAALVLPVLLLSHWLLRKDKPVNELVFRILSGLQLILLLVIMASAAQRLFLLTGNLGYGMTEARFYPMVFMIWLAVVCGLFAMTVLRGSRQYFAWGALWSAFFILGATNFFNPDDFIVRTNVRLMREGRPFDALYNTILSGDAVPALLDSLGEMNSSDACQVKSELNLRRINSETQNDARTWNWSRSKAFALLESNREILEAEGCEDVPQ